MDPAMQSTVNTFALGNHFFMESIFTLDDNAARRVVVENTNPILWMAGHLLNARKYLLDLFGDKRELPWLSKFEDPFDASESYPSMAELKTKWVDITNALNSRINQAGDEDFMRGIDWNLPNKDKTVRGALLFYCYHEAWHIGQIAYARKGMGMEGLVRKGS